MLGLETPDEKALLDGKLQGKTDPFGIEKVRTCDLVERSPRDMEDAREKKPCRLSCEIP